MIHCRKNHGVINIGSKIFIISGYDLENNKMLVKNECFDLVERKFLSIANVNKARSHFGITSHK
jgi:hypothetical protein